MHINGTTTLPPQFRKGASATSSESAKAEQLSTVEPQADKPTLPEDDDELVPTSTVMSAILLYQAARENWERDKTDHKNNEALAKTAEVIQDLVARCESLDKEGRQLLTDCLDQYL